MVDETNLDGSKMDSMWHATKTGPSCIEMDTLFGCSELVALVNMHNRVSSHSNYNTLK